MRFFIAALVATLFCCQAGTNMIEQELSGGDYYSQCEDTCGPHGDKSLLCHYPPGNEGNPQTICVGSNLVPDHLTHGDACGECELSEPECGDDVCEAPEDCSSCPEDCGTCPPVCGDQVCEDSENCSTCADDCGECPPVCGDQVCDEGESCDECAYDCGVCGPVCGDASCDEGENCKNCEADCGECPECPPECGNETCEDGESCSSCPRDCGECEPVCGDSVCESGEDCTTCPSDCGVCPPDCGNEVCEVGEDCDSCPSDCGNCPPVCDDGVCEGGENCKSCPADCGGCVVVDPPQDAGVEPEVTVTGGELGGCSTGGPGGLLSLLLVGGALYFMRRKKSMTTLLALLILALPAVATAQVVGDPGNFKLERFEMAMDEHSIITVEGAEVDRKGSGGLHLSLGYADDPLVLQENTGDGFKRVGALVGHQLSAEIGGYLAFTDSLAFGISLPMVLSQDRDAGDLTGLPSLSSRDISDPRFILKYQLAEQTEDEFNVAIGATATIPRQDDKADYLGGDSASIAPYLAVSDNYDSWRWAFNVGIKLQEEIDIVDLTISDEAFARIGAAKSWGVNEVGVTLSGTSSAQDLFTSNSSYSELMTAYSRRYDSGISSFVGGGIGLNEGFGAPDWRVFTGLRLDIDAPVKIAKVTPPLEVEPEPEPKSEPAPKPELQQVFVIPDAFFAFDKAEILPRYRDKLRDLALEMVKLNEEHPEYKAFLVVEGHTDSIGPDVYNLDLGERRAEAAAAILFEYGVSRDETWIISHGESRPNASNATEEGRATNRRIVIQFGANGELPDNFSFVVPDEKPDDESTFDDFGILKRK